MEIVNLEAGRLAAYCCEQIRRLIPFGDETEFGLVEKHLPEALQRLDHCVSNVAIWKAGRFDILHSSQYCIFLYYLSNTIWKQEKATAICTKLFLLNKQLNAIDVFYEIEMPEIFFIGHSVGIVLAKATYGNHLVLYQNSTVGKNNGVAPVIEDGVILYPNTAVIGGSRVRERSIIAQGVSVINRDTEPKRIVYQGAENTLVFRESRRDILSDFFRSV
ncbi:hypothetical protein E0I74_05585 [Rhizobium laguerreae]|uniref:Serine O-acetyltransferase n=1 Tax=Rhizobium laguerreae TaxID=1076926 RepID=A0A1S9GXB2_9HYPH|nr:hypothetical protein [Rhizobium laguerreae]MBB3162647.1 serine O-acetyltransferase [Rhizobium laguerreae]MBN9981243.1 hypothetical protein [Rhizobium laguerreae]MBY3072603.1 hypothetical protein [Rhizobium laguerreae]MBY3085430.1 hypothetical protein [Rhizobium laguerreae]MBY3090824.1 hypothetical protein [Rhizobium laguerreae]